MQFIPVICYKKSQLIDSYASIPENLEIIIGVKRCPFNKWQETKGVKKKV